MTGDEPFHALNCSIAFALDCTNAVTISQEPEYNIETGIALILKYVVVTSNNSNECIHNAFKKQT